MICHAMTPIRLGSASVGLSRFALTPVAEVIGTVRSRGRGSSSHVRRWYRHAWGSLGADAWRDLHILIPARDDEPVPHFLLPPRSHREGIDEAVERVRTADRDEIAAAFDDSACRAASPDRALHRARRELAAAGPDAVARRAGDALDAFFRSAVEPDWQRVRAVLEADVAFRADSMVTRGSHHALGEIAADLRGAPELNRLTVGGGPAPSTGVVLIPTTTPVWSMHPGPTQASRTVLYPARGVGRLWETLTGLDAGEALAGLIGTTRAALLDQLHQAYTTRALAARSGWSEATVSYHLGLLHRGGLISRTRVGARVLYARTAVGDALIDAVELEAA